MAKAANQSTDKQNAGSCNARGAKAKGSSHGQAGKFGQDVIPNDGSRLKR